MIIFMHVYVFLAINFVLNIFLGVVINNINEYKPSHPFLYSDDQNKWTDLQQRISLSRPIKLPPQPHRHALRLWLHKQLTRPNYRILPTVVVLCSAVTLFVPVSLQYGNRSY